MESRVVYYYLLKYNGMINKRIHIIRLVVYSVNYPLCDTGK